MNRYPSLNLFTHILTHSLTDIDTSFVNIKLQCTRIPTHTHILARLLFTSLFPRYARTHIHTLRNKIQYECTHRDNTWHGHGRVHSTSEPTFHGYARITFASIPNFDNFCPTCVVELHRPELPRSELFIFVMTYVCSVMLMLWVGGYSLGYKFESLLC